MSNSACIVTVDNELFQGTSHTSIFLGDSTIPITKSHDKKFEDQIEGSFDVSESQMIPIIQQSNNKITDRPDWNGAGIVVMVKDDFGTFLILGRDFTNTFADFGGKRDDTDRTSFYTAQRECFEETLQVIDANGLKVVYKNALNQRDEMENYCSYHYFVVEEIQGGICTKFKQALNPSQHQYNYKYHEVTQLLKFPTIDIKVRFDSGEKLDHVFDDHGHKQRLRPRTRSIIEQLCRDNVF